MKHLALIVYAMLLSFSAYSQKDSLKDRFKKEIDANHNWSHIGRSLNVNYNQYIGRHSVIIGIKFHQNSAINDNKYAAYFHSAYAKNFHEAIGLNLGYRYDLLKKHDYLMPYLFFQSQISNISYKYSWNMIIETAAGNYIDRQTYTTESIFTTENLFGFGLKVKLFNKLFLNQTIGAGIATFTNKNFQIINTHGKIKHTEAELCSSIKIGLIYQFNK